MKRYVALVLLLLLLGGCVAAPEAGGAIELVDSMDRRVTLAAPAERIVVLTAGDAEILYAIGAGDTVIGRGEYCDYPAEIAALPVVASGAETNIEQILALGPDLVLMDDMDQSPEQVEQLESAGLPVLMTDAHELSDVYEAAALIGAATGRTAEAAALTDAMQDAFSALAQPAGEGPSIYFEVSPLEYGLWAAGSDTFIAEIAATLGLNNIFADVSNWAKVSEEQVIARNPDIIVTSAMYFGEGPTPREEILSRAGWQEIAAVKNGAVYEADADALTRPGPRLMEAAEWLYEIAYGD